VLLLENQQAFIDEVVPHELAHLLVWKHFGRVAPHGKEWKWMMEAVLGVPARAPISSNSIRSAEYLPLPLPVPAASAHRPSP
jgi:SprT protein